ncbi:tyrosine-protein phosphatase [Streptomyces sp. NPDC057697]|uniref:tyrosine-protein phosphatase n=1 Tax=Streptomyces sp. NPDC057697 TaxID=3346219 RepID=UPI0036A430C2
MKGPRMSLVNFRDPSVLTDPEGALLSPGALYRSAQPFPAADEATVDQLRAAGIRTVVDLRGGSEREPEDWAAVEAAGITVVPASIAPTSPVLEARMATMTTAADLGAFYVLMAETAPEGVADAVRAAARPGGVLLHCAAGKDRTGFVTALLLELLGVSAERIVEDYARTGEALEQIWAGLAGRHRKALNDIENHALSVPAPLLEAPAEAMAVFLDVIRTRHGGARRFLLGCGVAPEAIGAFVAKAAPAAAPAPAATATAEVTV